MLNRLALTSFLSLALAGAPLIAQADGPAAPAQRSLSEAAMDDVLTIAEAALLKGQSGQASALALSGLKQAPEGLRAPKVAKPPTATRKTLSPQALDAVRVWQGLTLAVAAPPPAGPGLDVLTARQLYATALRRLQGNNFEEALPLLRLAHELEPRPQLLFEMARCYVHTGQMAQAIIAHQHYTHTFTAPAERLVAAASFGALVQEARAIR